MPEADEDEVWLDADAGPLVRPYTVSAGRTRPTVELDLLSLMIATGREAHGVDREHSKVLSLCKTPTSVAEISAYMLLPVTVTKILLSDLVDCEALDMRAPKPMTGASDRVLLEKLLDGLQHF